MVEAIAVLYRSGSERFEDLKQEAWLAALEAAARWKEDEAASLSTFARPRIHWALKNYLRRNKRPEEVSLDTDCSESSEGEPMHELIGTRETQEEDFEIKQKLVEFAKKHPAKVVEIVRLRVEGFSNKEIGCRLDMTEEAVEKAWERAVQSVCGKGSKAKRVA